MMKAPSTRSSALLLGFVSILALSVAAFSLRFFDFTIRDILLGKPSHILDSYAYLAAFYIHVGFGIVALVTGPFQFMGAIRNRWLYVHRLLGRIYLISILISGITGFMIAWFAQGGAVSTVGFSLLALGWLVSGFLAYQAILDRKITQHRNWMMRSYAFTFAAVTLRLGLLAALFGWVAFDTIYPIMAWACWLINLAVVELIIRKSNHPMNPHQKKPL